MDSNQHQREVLAPSSNRLQSRRSHHLISNEQWELHREEIYNIYVEKDKTLSETMKLMEDTHDFKASMRKYKMKIKEWKFEKYLRANDMKIIVVKATKRAREEGKNTVFYNGGQQISTERVEKFKKRNALDGGEMASPSAETPANITYHTPSLDSNSVSLDDIEWNDPVLEESFGRSYSTNAWNLEEFPSTATITGLTVGQFEPSNFTTEESFDVSSEASSEPFADDIIAPTYNVRGKVTEATTGSLGALDKFTQMENHTFEDPWTPMKLPLSSRSNTTDNQKDRLIGLYCGYKVSFQPLAEEEALKAIQANQIAAEVFDEYSIHKEAGSYHRRSIKELKEILGSFLDVRPNVVHKLVNTLQDTRSTNDPAPLIRSILAKYENFGLEDENIPVTLDLIDLYFEQEHWDELGLLISEIKSLVINASQIDIDPDILSFGISFAHYLSVLKQFTIAHSIFSSMLPQVWAQSDPKYHGLMAHSHLMFGLHYKRYGVLTEADEYLSLAYEWFEELKQRNIVMVVESYLSEAREDLNDENHLEMELEKRSALEAIEMVWVKRLLKEIRPARLPKTALKDVAKTQNGAETEDGGGVQNVGETEEGGELEESAEIDDTMTDITSCKYGITYSCSDITGISDSGFMVP